MERKTELGEQQALFDWAKYAAGKYPELKLMFHIPNEGKRSQIGGANLKAAGLSPGVPDICLPVARGKYNACYIELKKDKSCKTSKEQDCWIELLQSVGNFATVCHSADEAIQTLTAYLNLSKRGANSDDR